MQENHVVYVLEEDAERIFKCYTDNRGIAKLILSGFRVYRLNQQAFIPAVDDTGETGNNMVAWVDIEDKTLGFLLEDNS